MEKVCLLYYFWAIKVLCRFSYETIMRAAKATTTAAFRFVCIQWAMQLVDTINI